MTNQTPREKIQAERSRVTARLIEIEEKIALLATDRDQFLMQDSALEFALEALGPAPRRGRPAAGNGAQPAAPRVRKAKVRKSMRDPTTFDDKRSEYDAPC